MKNLYSSIKIKVEKTALSEEKPSVYVNAPGDIRKLWFNHVSKESWFTESQEMCVVFHLNTKYKIIGHSLITIGTLNSALIHPREAFRAAIVNNSCSIIIAHNHPSGDCAPSEADKAITRKIRDSGNILGIELLDHVIVGESELDKFYSFKESGMI